MAAQQPAAFPCWQIDLLANVQLVVRLSKHMLCAWLTFVPHFCQVHANRTPQGAWGWFVSDFVRCRTTEVRTNTGKEPQLNAFSWSSHPVDEQGFCKTLPNLTFSQNQVFIALQWADSCNQNELKIVGAPLSEYHPVWVLALEGHQIPVYGGHQVS